MTEKTEDQVSPAGASRDLPGPERCGPAGSRSALGRAGAGARPDSADEPFGIGLFDAPAVAAAPVAPPGSGGPSGTGSRDQAQASPPQVDLPGRKAAPEAPEGLSVPSAVADSLPVEKAVPSAEGPRRQSLMPAARDKIPDGPPEGAGASPDVPSSFQEAAPSRDPALMGRRGRNSRHRSEPRGAPRSASARGSSVQDAASRRPSPQKRPGPDPMPPGVGAVPPGGPPAGGLPGGPAPGGGAVPGSERAADLEFVGLEGISESFDRPLPDAATDGRPEERSAPHGARGEDYGREPALGEKGYSAGRRERAGGSEGPGESRQRPRGRRPSQVIREEVAPRGLDSAEPAADDRAGEEGAVDIPAWVEPEAAALSPRLLAKGRSELLPAGAGVSLDSEEPAEAPRAKEPVFKRILIDASDSEEVRIAVLEDGRLEELYYERPDEKKYLGNIYKGRVVNLEPAIQAAFVDLGIGRNGFLHVSDVLPAYKDSTGIPLDNLSMRFADRRRLKIQDILQRGQELLVQISKDAIGAKGPSLTTYVSVPGKYLVLMPGVNRHGVSKRIQDTEERAKLRENLVQLDLPKGVGYIVRTAGQDRPRADLEKDFQYLMKIWEEIRSRVRESSTPALLYEETDLVIRTLRDLFGPDVDEILMDSIGVYERARSFLAEVMPQAGGRLKHYTGSTPLFSRFGVEEEIEKIYNRRVPLPSGGYIVLEQTEALVAIDVNSGKYRDEEDLEATALKTNLEAAQEIARQLRLRDLGGVIVNDFIDMESEANRRAVERALRAALKRDRAKSWISRISRFGIIEMTRQRVRPSFERSNHEPCKHCRGTGVVKSARSLGIAILRQVRFTLAQKRREVCEVVAHASVVEYLLNDRRADLTALESSFKKTVLVKVEPTFSPEQYVIRSR